MGEGPKENPSTPGEKEYRNASQREAWNGAEENWFRIMELGPNYTEKHLTLHEW